MFKTISAVALVAAIATPSFAGNLSDPVIQEIQTIAAPASSSSAGMGAPAIIGAVVAVAAIAALIADNSSDDTTPPVAE